jgi:hypothetical protein
MSEQIPDSDIVPSRKSFVFSGQDHRPGNAPLQGSRFIGRCTVIHDDDLARDRNPTELVFYEPDGQIIGTITDNDDSQHQLNNLPKPLRIRPS